MVTGRASWINLSTRFVEKSSATVWTCRSWTRFWRYECEVPLAVCFVRICASVRLFQS